MDLSEKQLIESVFAGGGEMGARMRAVDWSTTVLGPVEHSESAVGLLRKTWRSFAPGSAEAVSSPSISRRSSWSTVTR